MNFLIPIDFSENSLRAARFALTHYPNGNFTLLHIVNVRQAGATMVVDINHELKASSRKKMDSTLEDFEKEFPDRAIKAKVEVGQFAETILQETDNTQADFIVMGTKGASGLDEVLLGSNAYLAIKDSLIPLIVINSSYDLKAPQKVLLASDFEGDLKNEVVKPLIDLKHKFNAEIHVIHITPMGEGSRTRMKINSLIDDEVERFHIIESDNIENAIANYVSEHDYDFLVLAPKYRGIIKNLFHQSVTKRICASARTPLIVLK